MSVPVKVRMRIVAIGDVFAVEVQNEMGFFGDSTAWEETGRYPTEAEARAHVAEFESLAVEVRRVVYESQVSVDLPAKR